MENKKIHLIAITYTLFSMLIMGIFIFLENQNTFLGGFRRQRGPSNTITLNSIDQNLLPNGNNTIDIGQFALAYKDVYVSSTVFAADISDLLYINIINSRIGISSSTPSAKFSVGNSASATSSIDLATPCFRMSSQSGSTDQEVYYYPCVGSACLSVLAAASGWVTSTISCF